MKELGIVRCIDLNLEDWLWATWRDRDFWQILEVKPFDKKKALAQLQQIFIDKHGTPLAERWWRSQITLVLSSEVGLVNAAKGDSKLARSAIAFLKSFKQHEDLIVEYILEVPPQLAQKMDSIAKKRNLTLQQLEDRIIPSCGLDKGGNRVFDFGDRQFYFSRGN